MSFGKLSNHFEGIAAKRLSEVETNPDVSNQHELNGVQSLKKILGDKPDTISFSAQFIYLGEEEDDTIINEGKVSWYDARANHATRTEHRFYYTANQVIKEANSNDLIIIAKQTNKTILFVVVAKDSTYENQLLWLFELQELTESGRFITRKMEDDDDQEIGYVGQLILSELGIETKEKESFIGAILREFGDSFPTTREFSHFARESLPDISSIDDPDVALIKWLEREELMFRSLERYLVVDKLKEGFGEDVDAFISFSLSIQNRRKSRAGRAFENHLEHIFIERKLKYSRGTKTEGKKEPDFLFPGIDYYKEDNFPRNKLTMLGAKSTCKDRWRQVLTEAAKIDEKHLITLEPGISKNQTEEMKSESLQLVLPSLLFETYSEEQQSWLIDLNDFISLAKSNQKSF